MKPLAGDNNAIEKCALSVEVNYGIGKENLIKSIRGLKVETLLERLDINDTAHIGYIRTYS